jgi:hypothetical protein
MILREEIIKEHSKAQALQIAEWIGHDQKRLNELIALFLTDEYRVVQRAAWIISMVAQKYPQLIVVHLPIMLTRCEESGLPVAVKRNVIRILQHIEIPESVQGTAMNLCFQLLSDPKETVAVRCFSMSVLAELSLHYPEIKQELSCIIKDALQYEQVSAGFKARAKKVLHQISVKQK